MLERDARIDLPLALLREIESKERRAIEMLKKGLAAAYDQAVYEGVSPLVALEIILDWSAAEAQRQPASQGGR
jgi:hypothetical protein